MCACVNPPDDPRRSYRVFAITSFFYIHRMHACTHTHICAHAHTHTHTHMCAHQSDAYNESPDDPSLNKGDGEDELGGLLTNVSILDMGEEELLYWWLDKRRGERWKALWR